MDELIIIAVLGFIVSAISSSANKGKKSQKQRDSKASPRTAPSKKATTLQMDWGKRAEEAMEKVLAEKNINLKGMSSPSLPYLPSTPQKGEGRPMKTSTLLKKPSLMENTNLMETSILKEMSAERGSYERPEVLVHHRQEKSLESRLSSSMEERMKPSARKNSDISKGSAKTSQPAGEQFLVFSEDPLVQGMIMGEIFTRPCDRKRGLR